MRELASGGPWWLPRLNGLPYVDKPIVYYAAGAAALAVAGSSEAAARAPSLLCTLVTAGIIWWFARRTIGPGAASPAAIAYAASPFTVAYARTVILDAALTLWTTLAIVAFACAVDTADRDGPPRTRWTLAGWSALALAVLTKGPVALALVLLVVAPYAAWRRRAGAVLDPIGLLLFLALVLPWVFAVSSRVPDYLRYVLVVETAQRVAAGTLGRTEPWWYFVPILAGAALPWTALLAGASPAVWRAVRGPARDPVVALCILWIALPLVLFSLSLSKRPQYVLPLIPAVALLAGWAWERASDRLAAARIAGGAVAAFGLVLLALATRIGPWIGVTPGVGALIPATARALGALLALTGGAAVALAARRDWPLLALAVPVSVIPVVAMPLMEAIGADRSSRSVADAVRPLLADDTEVVAVGTYPLSLPFYLGRTFTLATLDGRELTSNYVTRAHDRLRAQPGSTLRPADWWEEALAICRRPRLFVVPAGRDDLRRRFEPTLPLRATSRKVAVYGPCGPAPLARNE